MTTLSQTVVWVAVPNGTNGSVHQLSVVAFPRLFVSGGTATLNDFGDFLQWPGRSEGVNITIDFGGGITASAKRVGRKPDMPSWQALFDRTTAVDSYDQPRTTPHIALSYPAARMHQYLQAQYRAVGQQSPWAPPLAQSLITRFHDVAPGILREEQRSSFLKAVHQEFVSRGYVDDLNAAADPARDWLLSKLYFRPPQITDHGDSTASYKYVDLDLEQPGTDVRLEFHQMIGILTQHPDIARTFGLIMDFEFTAPANMSAGGWVKVQPRWSSTKRHPSIDATPLTRYGAGFIAAPHADNPEDLDGRIVDLSRGRYHLVQVDLDNALFKLQRTVERLPQKAGEAVALPSLTTGGLSILRQSVAWRESVWSQNFNTNYDQRVNDPGSLPIHAEDLLNGFRLDVWSDRSGQWHSLHRRTNAYLFSRPSKSINVEYQTEGWITPSLSELPSDLNLATQSLMVPPVARWTGWSLSAPQDPAPLEADPTLRFGVQYRVTPGSLPWLRFGTTYRFRMRTVDIAGNGLPYDPNAPDRGATGPVKYRRHEPVNAPVVIPTRDLAPEANTNWPGEAVDRLVVRSQGEAMLTDGADRHLAPPPSIVDICETHGMFDAGGGLNPAKLADGLNRETQSPPPWSNAGVLPVNWLPDPLARGAALQNLPGATAIAKPDFFTNLAAPIHEDGRWPGRQGVRLVVRGIILNNDLTWTPQEPQWDPATRTLVVYIAQSEMVTVPLSSYFAEQDLDLMALWETISQGASASLLQQLRQGTLDGRHWMLTPARELTLVHAVQKPLRSPNFQTIGASRALGETAAKLSGVIEVHGKSTAQVDVQVQWTEPSDEPDSDEPVWTGGAGAAIYVPVGDLNAATVGAESRFDFRDTKYRKLMVTATAESRFGDFFPAETDLTLQGESVEVDLQSTARPLAPKVLYVVPTFGWERPPTGGATKSSIRWGGGLRVYLDRPWYSTGEGEMLAVILYAGQPAGLSALIRRPEVPENIQPWVTVWGTDPLWRSRDTHAQPQLSHFKSALATQNGLTLDEVPGTPILVAGHMVQFDQATRRWYCDIEVDAGPAYFPFIRLALARYQPKSVPGAHLSPVVTADIVQTAPNRTATVAPVGSSGLRYAVAVAGETYSAGRAGPALVEVTLERADATYSGDLRSWAAVLGADGAPRRFTLEREGYAWLGTIELPEPTSLAARFRLIIQEYEQLIGDNGPIRRLVYADAVEL